jgi:hypothetical protein
MTTMRRVLELMHRDDCDLLTETEQQAEYSKLLKTFSVEEMREVNKLYNWYGSRSCADADNSNTYPRYTRAADLQP